MTAPAVRKPLVACIDDDPVILEWLQAMLSDAGYEVRTEADSAKAVEFVRSSHPEVVLLDISMPDPDGYDVCRRLQQYPETSFIPVIFVTGRRSEQDRVRAFQAGAVDYLVKPLDEWSLLASVSAQVTNRQKWSELRRIGAGKPDSGDAPHWSSRFDPSGFSLFKSFLSGRLQLPAERRRFVASLTPGTIYSGAAKLGIDGAQVARAMSEFLKLPCLELLDAGQVKLGVFPLTFAMTNQILAMGQEESTTFVVSNPFNWEIVEILVRICGDARLPTLALATPATFEDLRPGKKSAAPKPATLMEIQAKLRQEYSALAPAAEISDREAASAGPLIDLVNRLIEEAYVAGASDIHIEPAELEVVIRYRIDGDLRVVNRLQPVELNRRLIARVKVMSELDMAEHRLPQDGRIRFKQYCGGKHDFDLRVAILPVNFGEKACLRIIDKQKSVMPLERLGFSDRNLRTYREKIRAPHGMILHVGPTGSGKSMSLYAALNEVMTPAMNIQTAEDPIEYTLPGINQSQMNSDIGLTFARALRSFLRADPDIILVGEIRDLETARTAIEASLTGHLLFSTLHTNDAASTVQRFIEMGIESYLISSTLLMVCAQRLLRRLCPKCKEAYAPANDERVMAGLARDGGGKLYRGRGCDACDQTGYKGRIAVHEILVPNDGLRRAINRPGITSTDLKQLAVETCGMTTLFQDAMEKVRQGLCSMADALANVAIEEVESGVDLKGPFVPTAVKHAG